VGGGVQLGPFGTAATNRLIVPDPGDYDDWHIFWMMIGRGNRSTRRKSVPGPLCPPQTPHAAWTQTRDAAVGSQQLTAWATARPLRIITFLSCVFQDSWENQSTWMLLAMYLKNADYVRTSLGRRQNLNKWISTLEYVALCKYFFSPFHKGHAVALLVEALCYKRDGGGIESRWGHWTFSIDLILPSAVWLRVNVEVLEPGMQLPRPKVFGV
jgi:hypothetical protein